jgi:methyltransferase-like protein
MESEIQKETIDDLIAENNQSLNSSSSSSSSSQQPVIKTFLNIIYNLIETNFSLNILKNRK